MRIGYWTTACLQPEIEAVSKEVFQLATYFQGSFIFGMSSHYLIRVSWKNRSIGVHNGFDPLLRVLIPVVESKCNINHVYGDPNPWTFYKSLRCKPIILTVSSEKGVPRPDFISRCCKILVQTGSYYEKLRSMGVDKDKLELLYPGVDLKQFRPDTSIPAPGKRPRILFATAPRTEEEMQKRGVNLLLDAAKLSPNIDYRLLYRDWDGGYTSLMVTEKLVQSLGVQNVILTNNVVPNMHCIYPQFDFTVIPYTTADGGKECPTSAIEGLACGLPTLISSVAPFAQFVNEHSCGVVFEPTPRGLVAAVECGMGRYRELSANAVKAAGKHFSLERMLRRTSQIYHDLAAR